MAPPTAAAEPPARADPIGLDAVNEVHRRQPKPTSDAAPTLPRLSRLSRTARAIPPVVLDGAVGVVLTLGSWLWPLIEPQAGTLPPDARSLALTAAVNLPLALRRRFPVTVLAVSVVACGLYHALDYHHGQNTIAPMLALYSVAAHGGGGRAAAAFAPAVAIWAYAASFATASWWAALVQSLLVNGIIAALGASSRTLAARNHQLAQLAEQLRREQEAAADRAVSHERVKIARELHDIVAHDVSAMVIQADGAMAALLDEDTDEVGKALRAIAHSGRNTLSELRLLVVMLREAPTRPQPGVADIAELAERMPLPVRLRIEGEVRELPAGMGLAAYRIVQEALTNTLKHAGKEANAEVLLHYAHDVLRIRITDDGAAAAHGRPGAPGHGLLGIRERAAMFGGGVRAAPLPGGGFQVEATLPWT